MRHPRLRVEPLEARALPSAALITLPHPTGAPAPGASVAVVAALPADTPGVSPSQGRPTDLPAAKLFERLDTVAAPAASAAQLAAQQPIGLVVHPELPTAPAFFDTAATFLQSSQYRLGLDGVLQSYSPYAGWANSPLDIARFTIALYMDYQQTGDLTDLPALELNADWLAAHIQARTTAQGQSYDVIPYSFGVPDFAIPPGFVSAPAAAAEVDALYLASLVAARPDWYTDAYALTTIFHVPVAQGGVLISLSSGTAAAWYEEFASPTAAETPRTLNGDLLTLTWLDWYATTAQLSDSARQDVANLFQAGIAGLLLSLPQYDEPSLQISVYDLEHRGWNQAYADGAVTALDYLAQLSSTPGLETYANRWRGHTYPATTTGTAVRIAGDLNGDGQQDLLHFDTDGSWHVSLAGGNPTNPGVVAQWSGNANWQTVFAGDVTGDGRADLIGFNYDGSWWVGVSSGSGVVTQQWAQWSAASHWSRVFVGDFNGDGKLDIAGFNKDGTWWVGISSGNRFVTQPWAAWSAAGNWADVFIGDFNGDHKADVAGFNYDGSWWVGLATPGHFSTTMWSQWSAAHNWSGVYVGDFNGDGRSDFAGFGYDGAWWVGTSTGVNATTQQWAQWPVALDWTDVVVSNYLRNGKADVIGFNADGSWWVGESNGAPAFQTQVLA